MEACLKLLTLSSEEPNAIKNYSDKRLPKECRNEETFKALNEIREKLSIELQNKINGLFGGKVSYWYSCLTTSDIETYKEKLQKRTTGKIETRPGAFRVLNFSEGVIYEANLYTIGVIE